LRQKVVNIYLSKKRKFSHKNKKIIQRSSHSASIGKNEAENIHKHKKKRTITSLESMKEPGSRQQQEDTEPPHPGKYRMRGAALYNTITRI